MAQLLDSDLEQDLQPFWVEVKTPSMAVGMRAALRAAYAAPLEDPMPEFERLLAKLA